MKEKAENKSIEGLFRDKLSEYQFETTGDFWPRLERKLRFREFFKFRPRNFNVFYLGGIIASGIIVVSMLISKDNARLIADSDLIVRNAVTSEQINNDMKEPLDTNVRPTNKDKKDSNKADVNDSQRAVSIVNNDKEIDLTNVPGSLKKLKSGEIIIDLAKHETVETNSLVQLKPVAEFRMNRNYGCIPLSISFENLSINIDSCLWVFSDGGISTDFEPVWIFDEEGEYEISLIVFSNNTKAIRKATVNAYAVPIASFKISTVDSYLPGEQVVFYNYSENSVAWEWDFGDGTGSNEFEPAHSYKEYGSYTVKLKVISEYACADSMILTDAFGSNSCYVKFPNAFIPNEGGPTGGYYSNRSDEQSEVFHPVWSGVSKYNLRIFSKQGMLVFETDDIQIGWDGYYKGRKVEKGVYIWEARGVFYNGDHFVKVGDVTLIPKW